MCDKPRHPIASVESKQDSHPVTLSQAWMDSSQELDTPHLPRAIHRAIAQSMETLEPQVAENPTPSLQEQSIPYHFKDPAVARAMQAKAVERTKANRAKNLSRIDELEKQLALLGPIALAATAKIAAVALEPDDHYRLKQLARTREAIESLWDDLANAELEKDKKSISDAIARLSDVEFSLAKRPKPAAYRTQPEKPSKRSSQVEPED